jgi:hypothetical protein
MSAVSGIAQLDALQLVALAATIGRAVLWLRIANPVAAPLVIAMLALLTICLIPRVCRILRRSIDDLRGGFGSTGVCARDERPAHSIDV